MRVVKKLSRDLPSFSHSEILPPRGRNFSVFRVKLERKNFQEKPRLKIASEFSPDPKSSTKTWIYPLHTSQSSEKPTWSAKLIRTISNLTSTQRKKTHGKSWKGEKKKRNANSRAGESFSRRLFRLRAIGTWSSRARLAVKTLCRAPTSTACSPHTKILRKPLGYLFRFSNQFFSFISKRAQIHVRWDHVRWICEFIGLRNLLVNWNPRELTIYSKTRADSVLTYFRMHTYHSITSKKLFCKSTDKVLNKNFIVQTFMPIQRTFFEKWIKFKKW